MTALVFFGIVLVILRAVGEINWPWIWVLCPLWAPVVWELVQKIKERTNGKR